MPIQISSGYTGVSVTILNDGANHSLFSLIRGVDPLASVRAKYLVIQNDVIESNDDVLIGSAPNDDMGQPSSAALSASNYGVRLQKGDSETFQLNVDEDFNIARLWARTSGAGTVQLNIQIIRG